MSDYESMVADLAARYPHLVMTMSGPWRDKDGVLDAEPWIVNFKNASLSLQEVHSGSRGTTMTEALGAGMDFLDRNADDTRVRDCARTVAQSP